MRLVLFTCCLFAFATGCNIAPRAPVVPAHGAIYTNLRAPLDTVFDDTKLGTKVGTGEIVTYLGLISTGDASIKSAADSAQITTVHHADYESFNLLGKIYEKKSDKRLAIENTEKFLDLWKDADPDLPDLIDAKERLARLKGMTQKNNL